MRRLSRVLGGRGVGVKKRLWLHLASFRPLAAEISAWVAQPRGAGGMSAQAVTDWKDELKQYRESYAQELPVLDQNHIEQARADFRSKV